MSTSFAAKGSQRWLQVAVSEAPKLLDRALRRSGAIGPHDTVCWRSPLKDEGFREYQDAEVLTRLNIGRLPNGSLSEFWPKRGPVWDALGVSSNDNPILVEAKAHIPEAASPPSKASPKSLELIRRSLNEARQYYAPQAKADWSSTYYQYANRLAFQYFLSEVNDLQSRLVFLYFCNADDVKGPNLEAEWRGVTCQIHDKLGLPADLTSRGVFHAYLDVRDLPEQFWRR